MVIRFKVRVSMNRNRDEEMKGDKVGDSQPPGEER
jgi:hypothetical protein